MKQTIIRIQAFALCNSIAVRSRLFSCSYAIFSLRTFFRCLIWRNFFLWGGLTPLQGLQLACSKPHQLGVLDFYLET